ncbi:MAG TPA: SLBB domain-containing protein [Fimbriimonadaceae bacterium]|nr:SLBB domain-containing protein [Fimbriimonadaceae bacterium]
MIRLILLAVTLINFKLLPLDRIAIASGHSALSGEYVIATDGFVRVPMVGDFAAAGRTTIELAESLQGLANSKGIVCGNVSVMLIGTERQDVSFSGSIENPGSVVWYEGLTINDVSKLAKPRPGSVPSVETPLRNVLKSVGKNHVLSKGGRVIYAAPTTRNSVLVLGGVLKPGEYEFADGATVQEAIDLAGGLTVHADRNAARHTSNGQTRAVELTAKLAPGDVLHFPIIDNPKLVTVVGIVSRPGKVGFFEGMTLTKALEAVGWPLHNADQKKVTILRVAGGTSKIHTVDFVAIKSGKLRDFILKPGDLIEVPKKR